MAFPANRGIIWCYNLTNPDMRAYWVNECVEAVKKGCTGCFIDQANVAEGVAGWPAGSPVVAAYAKAHMLAQTELAEALKPTDNYAIYNHLGNANYSTTAMMIEDFVGYAEFLYFFFSFLFFSSLLSFPPPTHLSFRLLLWSSIRLFVYMHVRVRACLASVVHADVRNPI